MAAPWWRGRGGGHAVRHSDPIRRCLGRRFPPARLHCDSNTWHPCSARDRPGSSRAPPRHLVLEARMACGGASASR